MAAINIAERSAGASDAGGFEHADTSAHVVATVALIAGNTYQFLFMAYGAVDTGNAESAHLAGFYPVVVRSTDGPGWAVSAGSAFGVIGSDATPTWAFAMNGDTLEASATGDADTFSMGAFLKLAIPLIVAEA